MQLALSNGYLLQTPKTFFPVIHTDPQTVRWFQFCFFRSLSVCYCWQCLFPMTPPFLLSSHWLLFLRFFLGTFSYLLPRLHCYAESYSLSFPFSPWVISIPWPKWSDIIYGELWIYSYFSNPSPMLQTQKTISLANVPLNSTCLTQISIFSSSFTSCISLQGTPFLHPSYSLYVS